jgi:hypothetical protein
MGEVQRCRQCGVELTGDSPDGACAACRTLTELAPHFPSLELLHLLGQGGMGTVYKARQLKLDRLVALKVLSVGPATGATFADRFLREARALARLGHPHIVTIHDFGEAGQLYYFVMEFVEGGSLRQLLRRGPLGQAEALGLVVQMSDALSYAHEEGIVHRDVKPENILLDRRGRIKIADFGLAKLLGPMGVDFTLTRSQQGMGTPHYMAPEQWEKAHTVDHRADVWSLGVVLYEMLTGELPLGRFALPSQKAPVDARLDDVVLRALEKDPPKRYQQVADLRADIEAIARASPVPPLPQKAEAVSVGDIPTFTGALPRTLTPITAATAEQVAITGTVAPKVDEAALETARRQVKGPAAGLMLVGWLSVLFAMLIIVMVFSVRSGEVRSVGQDKFYIDEKAEHRPPKAADITGLTLGLLAVQLLGMTFGIVTILAARKMWRLESAEFVLIGSILAMVPVSPAWGIGLPMGLWALLVLRKPEVQAAFAAPKPATAPAFDWWRLVPRTISRWGVVCCVVGIVLCVLPWGGVLYHDPQQATRMSRYEVLGVLTWPGLAATLLLVVLGTALLAGQRSWSPSTTRWGRRALAFLRLVLPLTGLVLVLLFFLMIVSVGGHDAARQVMRVLGLFQPLALVMIAALLLRKSVWRPVALILVGLAILCLVGAFVLEPPAPLRYLVYEHTGSVRDSEWASGRTWAPWGVMGCAGALVGLGCGNLWAGRAARRARRFSEASLNKE